MPTKKKSTADKATKRKVSARKTKPKATNNGDNDNESEKNPENSVSLKGGIHGAELDALLRAVVYRGKDTTLEDVANKFGISSRALYNIRVDNKLEIEKLRAEFFEDVEPEVRNALLESCKGAWTIPASGVNAKQAPNPKSLELFYSLRGDIGQKSEYDSFAVYDRFWPYDKQAQFIYSCDPTGKLYTVFFIGGIGSGKTYALAEKALRTARLNRGCSGMLVSPTYKMLQNPLLETLKELCTLHSIPFKHKKADSVLELWGDTQILLRSAENPENLRGPNLAWVGGDELRNWDLEAYNVSIGRIRDPRARQRIFFGVSTPDGFDWLYDLIAGPDSEKREKNCKWFQAKSVENPALPLDMVELARNTYDETYASQELDGQFVNVGRGRIYPHFERELHVGEYALDSSLPVWIGQDFNVNPMASVIMQPRVENGLTHLYVIGENAIKGADINALIETLAGKGYTPTQWGERLEIYPDASGFNHNVSATKSPGELLRRAGYITKNPRANPLIRDRYAAVNGKLRNANNVVTLHIDRSCRNLINDLEREVYKEGAPVREDSRDGAKERGHWADALGYVVHYHFRLESGFTPQRMS